MSRYCLVYDSADILHGGDITDYFRRIRIGYPDREGNLHPDEIFPDFTSIDEARQAARAAWRGGAEFVQDDGSLFHENARAALIVYDATTGTPVDEVRLTTKAPCDGDEVMDPGCRWSRMGWVLPAEEAARTADRGDIDCADIE